MSSVPHSQSDSENDDDYIPPAREELSSDSEDESQLESQHVKESGQTAQEAENKQKGREALWADFQASVTSSTEQKIETAEKKRMVKIQRRYLFAGEYTTEVVEVPEDSPEAKKWPLCSGAKEKTDPHEPTNAQSGAPSVPPSDSSAASASMTSTASSAKLPIKKPGPRKPKTVLGALPSSQKVKKLTTLDKSLLDWKVHTQDTELQGELEVNRRGGGYLEKVEFLRRVEDRKEENLEAMKSRKRRKL